MRRTSHSVALYDGTWQGAPKGTVAIRVPSTDWLNFAHAAAEGQQVSPGKQRQVDEEDVPARAGTAESKNDQMTVDQRILATDAARVKSETS